MKFHSILGSPTTKFHSILGSQTTKFHSISESPTTKYHPILRSPTSVHLSLLEAWHKAGACKIVPLPNLRNTWAPSTNWGSLPYFTNVHCTLYTVYCTLYTVHFSPYTFPNQFFHTTFHTIFPHNYYTPLFNINFLQIFSTQFNKFFHQIPDNFST